VAARNRFNHRRGRDGGAIDGELEIDWELEGADM
jgi:hypothetical protein